MPVDKALPGGVRHKVLEKLYIPDGDGDAETTGKGLDQSLKTFIYDLVDESLRLTGNLSEEELADPLSARRRKWRSAGTIRAFDHEVGNYIPVSGVQVRARRWFTTYKGFTSSTGYYSVDGRFRRKANYSIKWDRFEFSIRSGSIGQAVLNGPKIRGNWNVDLGNRNSTTVNDAQQYYAIIHQGAMDYYYGSRLGLTSPPRNSNIKRQLKIAARQKNGTSSYVKARKIWFGADISLQAWNRASDQVYATIIHELAHSAHRQVDRHSYNNIVWDAYTGPCTSLNGCDSPGPIGSGARRLLETWASTVEIVLTRHRYQKVLRRTAYVHSDKDFQERSIALRPFYTSAGYDMLDAFNQRTDGDDGVRNDLPDDNVSGFKITELERALKEARTWRQWCVNLYDQNPRNDTRDNLEEFFANWTD